ncbi:MAG: phosphoglucosamine mutase [Clostridia bacterium]|nr:phosphoglucosamine mutase [Clostridia bacterium]
MGKIFGTDGARGVAGKEITPELAFWIGKASATVLSKDNEKPVFVIGKDTRISGDMLENALIAGLTSMGADVIRAGVIPTPAVAYLVLRYEADAGVVISASHNSYEFNGIKLFNNEGFKLDDSIQDEIEDIIINKTESELACNENIGRVFDKINEGHDLYIDFLLSTIDVKLEGIKVVLDCANGAAYSVAPKVYERLGAEVITIGNEPNGININDNCGSTKTAQLCKKVVEVKADVGLAYDGDADRLMVVDELGNEVNGDITLGICAEVLKNRGELYDNRVTATVMSNIGFHKFIKEINAKVDITNVGDRYVIESMLRTGCVLGGEQSGHIIFLNYTTTGDGTLSSLQFVKALIHSGKKVSELASRIEMYPQVLENAKVKNEHKHDYTEDVEVQVMINEVEREMEGQGRVLIRPSGTEPLVRVMIEGQDIEQITAYAKNIASLLERKFG